MFSLSRTALFAVLTVWFIHGMTSAPTPAAAQDASIAVSDPQEESLTEKQKEQLATINRIIARLEPKMDEEGKSSLEALRASMERVALDRDNATYSDMELFKEMRRLAEMNRDPLPEDFKPLRARVKALAATTPKIETGEWKRPGKKGGVGYVTLQVNGKAVTLAQIPNAANGLSPTERARRISQRIKDAAAADPLWFTKTKPKIVRGLHVVGVPTAPDGYVLTADPEFARMRQMTPLQLAQRLAADIRNTMDRPYSNRADKQGDAFGLYAKASAAYTAGKTAAAEALYKEAIANKPDYLAPYEDLAGIYAERKDTEKLTETVNAALAIPGISEEDKTRLRSLLK